MAQLREKEITELMKALGFHKIPSRNRWKLKVSDTVWITDHELVSANEAHTLQSFLIKRMEDQLLISKSIERKIKMIVAFFN